MPLVHSLDLAFVHVQKTAGVSILKGMEDAGLQADWAGHGLREIFAGRPEIEARFLRSIPDADLDVFPQVHLPAAIMRDLVGEARWSRLFTFGFVRNPWDRFVSFYHYQKERYGRADVRERHPSRATFFDRATDFETFVRIFERDGRTMTSMLAGDDGALLVDFVGRYERLDEDLAVISRRVGTAIRPPHLNRSEHPPYRELYSRRARAIVADLYAEDIANFDYTF